MVNARTATKGASGDSRPAQPTEIKKPKAMKRSHLAVAAALAGLLTSSAARADTKPVPPASGKPVPEKSGCNGKSGCSGKDKPVSKEKASCSGKSGCSAKDKPADKDKASCSGKEGCNAKDKPKPKA